MTAGAAYPGSLSADLREYLHRTLEATPAAGRRDSHWVMSHEWLLDCLQMDGHGAPFWSPGPAGMPQTLLGLPIEVREDAGAPRLEGNA